MRYYYEYKYKNGCKVGGHNLERIEFCDYFIKLIGKDEIPTNYDYEIHYWETLIDMRNIEYLKIWTMEEKDND